jgi:monodechloroaminopyrrolnitrin synthase
MESAHEYQGEKGQLAEAFELETRLDSQVSESDPCDMNRFFATDFVKGNRDNDPSAIIGVIESFDPNTVENMDVIGARAATRDFGMLASALVKINQSPQLPQKLQDILISLSRVTNEVPRDTVFSYGPRNSDSAHQRRFTDREEEKMFITGFSNGMGSLKSSLIDLEKGYKDISDGKETSESLVLAKTNLEGMRMAIVDVMRKVPPEIFTHELRPYFDPIEIEGKSYLAPGGAQMPLLLVDQMVWGSDCAHEGYTGYVKENMIYSPPSLRDCHAQMQMRPSLVTIALERKNPAFTRQVLDILHTIKGFRMPHRKVADANFKLRNANAVGSGGYKPDFLDTMIELTKTYTDQCEKSLESNEN